MDPHRVRLYDIVSVNFGALVIGKSSESVELRLLDDGGNIVFSNGNIPIEFTLPYVAVEAVVVPAASHEGILEKSYVEAVEANAMLRKGMEELGQRIEEQSKIIEQYIAERQGTTIDMEVLKKALVELNVLPNENVRSSMFPIDEPVELKTDREKILTELRDSQEVIVRLEADLRKSDEEAHSLKVLAFQIQDRALKAEAENEILREKIHRLEQLSGINAPEPLSPMDIARMRSDLGVEAQRMQSRSRLNRPGSVVTNVFETGDLGQVAAVINAGKEKAIGPEDDLMVRIGATSPEELENWITGDGEQDDSGSYIPRNY